MALVEPLYAASIMIDWLLGLLTPAQWDAWRGWLTTLGGLVALFVATSTYLRNGRIKREEQARLVYSKHTHVDLYEVGQTFSLKSPAADSGQVIEGAADVVMNPDSTSAERWLGLALQPLIQVRVVIHNGSKELIGPARLQVLNAGNGLIWEDFSIKVDAVGPETDYVVDAVWINSFHPGMPSLATTVIFRDASGQWWRRHRSEPIERVHDDPENSGPTAAERSRIRQQQSDQGVLEAERIQEPRPTAAVRLHRLLRRWKGKSPTP